MNPQRRKERYTDQDAGFIVQPPRGEPYRADGRPLTDYDRAILAGEDPLKLRKRDDKAPSPS